MVFSFSLFISEYITKYKQHPYPTANIATFLLYIKSSIINISYLYIEYGHDNTNISTYLTIGDSVIGPTLY